MPTSISKERRDGAGQPDYADWIKKRALKEGFDVAGIASPSAIRGAAPGLYAFLEAGFHGGMGWLAANPHRRADPQALWPEVCSIIMAGINYAPDADPPSALQHRSRAAISVYAQGDDYHDVIKGKLKAVAGDFARLSGADVKVFVDTAPVMEKPLAQAAGLGWQGKHTNLVSRDFGSWLFLGAIFTTAVLKPGMPDAGHCGTCRRCLDACPTQAFPKPYQLDARRCISYLTIEHKGHIPREFRRAIGNRIYGCDDCLAVCPWNKFAARSREYAFLPKIFLTAPKLADLVSLNDTAFRQVFADSPIKRIGRARFIRNVLIAIGNSGDATLAPPVEALLDDPSPLVRAMAVWALEQLLDNATFVTLRTERSACESDAGVVAEWSYVAHKYSAQATESLAPRP